MTWRWLERSFDLVRSGALVAVAAFILLPLLALSLAQPPAVLLGALGTPEAAAALKVSLTTSAFAIAIVVAIGTPLAHLMAREQFRGKRVLDVVIDLPLVLPPAVAGIALLEVFGRNGFVGGELDALGITVSFSRVAVVLALAFVAGPLFLRQAQLAFSSIGDDVAESLRVGGVSRWRGLWLVELPLARRGLAAGAALCWARALGEFGATMIFAGNLEGATQTMTLAIYGRLADGDQLSLALATLLLAVSFVVLLLVRGAGIGASFSRVVAARA